jgi:phosphatidylserine decarboxylase
LNPALVAVPALLLGAYLYWRHIWFFRNPARTVPPGDHIISPADGRVVYIRLTKSHEDVIVIKQGVAANLTDIVRQDVEKPKLHIGIFMSPFNVHYNRVPLTGRVEAIQHHPPRGKNRCMAQMHWRTLLNRPPFQKNSLHLMTNERLVTRLIGEFKGRSLPYYLVQIAGKKVNGIDSYCQVGAQVAQGEIFGMIRIGSQVDLVVPYLPDMDIRVRPGEKVRAGESILIS